MDFSDSANASATKFLQDFCAQGLPPDGGLELELNWPTFTEAELEGECLSMARNYLAKRDCPGYLSYHISAEACKQLLQSGSVARWQAKEGEGGGSGEGDSKPPQLDSKLVALSLQATILKVCQEWAKSLPRLSCPTNRPDLSIFAVKNTRRRMEDRHALCVDVNSLFGFKDCPPQTYYGVFDGHIGIEAASYAAIHLLSNMARHPKFLTDPEVAMKDAFRVTDERFCQKGIKAGSTVVATLMRGEKLYVGWLGDSQAYLIKRGKPISLVDPHKPNRQDEQERIEAAGGMVIWLGVWRVNGNLSVSRAIGDAADKKFVIGEADVQSYDLDGTEDYLVLACDGVWDVLSGEELHQCVYKHLSSGGSKSNVARAIVEFAREEGSSDNMTAIVVFLPSFQLVPLEAPSAEVQVDSSCQGDPAASS